MSNFITLYNLISCRFRTYRIITFFTQFTSSTAEVNSQFNFLSLTCGEPTPIFSIYNFVNLQSTTVYYLRQIVFSSKYKATSKLTSSKFRLLQSIYKSIPVSSVCQRSVIKPLQAETRIGYKYTKLKPEKFHHNFAVTKFYLASRTILAAAILHTEVAHCKHRHARRLKQLQSGLCQKFAVAVLI